jgi:hypothetical protein
MSVHMPACPVARNDAQRWTTLSQRRLGRLATALLLAATLAACAGRPVPYAGPDPSDPAAPVRAVTYRSTIAPYTRQRPVEPAPWGQQNERVTPAPRP